MDALTAGACFWRGLHGSWWWFVPAAVLGLWAFGMVQKEADYG
jgi:hypothetical protein